MEDLKEIKSRGNTAYVVNPFGYRWLLSNASMRQKIILTILQVLAIGLIQFLMVTYDKRSNMTELLYSTAKGRHVLHRRKTMAGGLPVILLWIVEWTALIQIVMRSGGSFHFANASLSNLSFTKALPEFLSIGLFLGILAVLHLIFLLFIMQISSFLFRRLSKIN